jgi:hypothetical protein
MLTNFPYDPILDLAPWIGQRSESFIFRLVNGATGENLGEIHPLRSASLTHDTTRTIKRQLDLQLGVEDTAAINPVSDRVDVFMVTHDGTNWPLGRYMFTDQTKEVFTSGDLSNVVCNDEMFLVDQEIIAGVNGIGASVVETIQLILDGLPINYISEASPFACASAWAAGTKRGSILDSLSISGDYFSPWFGNDGKMHVIRTFDPASVVPDFNFDTGKKVYRQGVSETSDLLTAPNRFVVISNTAADPDSQLVAVADVAQTAPHSQLNRGFTIAETYDLQLSDVNQAAAVAQGFVNRRTIFEKVNLTTAIDPRHDSYNVIVWQGSLWLELAWSMALTPGGGMNHSLRKAYSK